MNTAAVRRLACVVSCAVSRVNCIRFSSKLFAASNTKKKGKTMPIKCPVNGSWNCEGCGEEMCYRKVYRHLLEWGPAARASVAHRRRVGSTRTQTSASSERTSRRQSERTEARTRRGRPRREPHLRGTCAHQKPLALRSPCGTAHAPLRLLGRLCTWKRLPLFFLPFTIYHLPFTIFFPTLPPINELPFSVPQNFLNNQQPIPNPNRLFFTYHLPFCIYHFFCV